MGSQFKLEVANVSDVGCIRPHNEDSTASNEALGILVLADGMGGYKAGEVASAIAVTSIYNDVISGLQNSTTTGIDEASGLDRHSILLRDAVNNANSFILNVVRTKFILYYNYIPTLNAKFD